MTPEPQEESIDSRTDEALCEAWTRGDRAALGELYRRYRAGVTTYARRMLRSHEEAEDVCVEAFTQVLKGRYQARGSFRSFLFTVTHRLCLDRFRRSGRAQRALDALPEPGGGDSPEDTVVQGDRLRKLGAAIDKLPEAHRSVILLYYGQDLTSKEVAEILGWRHDQARSKIAYACRLLREAMGTTDEEAT